jgi:hypothetical protein
MLARHRLRRCLVIPWRGTARILSEVGSSPFERIRGLHALVGFHIGAKQTKRARRTDWRAGGPTRRATHRARVGVLRLDRCPKTRWPSRAKGHPACVV